MTFKESSEIQDGGSNNDICRDSTRDIAPLEQNLPGDADAFKPSEEVVGQMRFVDDVPAGETVVDLEELTWIPLDQTEEVWVLLSATVEQS